MTDRAVTCWYLGEAEFTCPCCEFHGVGLVATDGRTMWANCPQCHGAVVLPDESPLDIS